MTNSPRRLGLTVLTLALLSAGCGDSNDQASPTVADDAAGAPTVAPAATPPPKIKMPPALLPPAANDDQTTRDALQKLREQVDPKQINWGRAGYDFGEGFKGPKGDRR